MDINHLRSLVTVLSFLIFIGICLWAWNRRRAAAFDEAARLPLEEDQPVPARGASHE